MSPDPKFCPLGLITVFVLQTVRSNGLIWHPVNHRNYWRSPKIGLPYASSRHIQPACRHPTGVSDIRTRLFNLLFVFLAVWALVVPSKVDARCVRSRQGSIENVADYVLAWSDVVALVRAMPTADDSVNRHSLRILSSMKPLDSKPHGEIVLLDDGRISSSVSRSIARGDIFLLTARFDEEDVAYRLHECLELAVASVDNDALILFLRNRLEGSVSRSR